MLGWPLWVVSGHAPDHCTSHSSTNQSSVPRVPAGANLVSRCQGSDSFFRNLPQSTARTESCERFAPRRGLRLLRREAPRGGALRLGFEVGEGGACGSSLSALRHILFAIHRLPSSPLPSSLSPPTGPSARSAPDSGLFIFRTRRVAERRRMPPRGSRSLGAGDGPGAIIGSPDLPAGAATREAQVLTPSRS